MLVAPDIKQYVEQISAYPKVIEFLSSYNTKKTQATYRSSLIKFNNYLESKYNGKAFNCNNIISSILKQEIDAYELLRGFTSYLPILKEGITPSTISNYVTAIRSYFEFWDIDTHKFRRKVKLPKIINQKEQAIDKKDIYQMLISCHNKRLKSFLLLLISSGSEQIQKLFTLRNCDVDFNSDPVQLHIRGEYTKTKTTRISFLTPEAKKFLLEYINYRGKADPEQLLFSAYNTGIPKTVKETQRMSKNIYIRLSVEFIKLLNIVDLAKRKETGILDKRRHCITFHSCRRFTSTILEDIVGKGYHDFILGHNGYMNMYHTQKMDKIIEDYKRCYPYLTVLDRGFLEATGKSIEAKLEAKDKQIGQLIEKYANRDDVIRDLSDTVIQMKKELDELRNEPRQ